MAAASPIEDAIPSSSPAFGTPAHPIQVAREQNLVEATPSILPIILPPATLRPLAFRIFTKKHNLTLSSPALGLLATKIGKHCGYGWREEGTAERILDEAAKQWKKKGGGVLVSDEGGILNNIFQQTASVLDLQDNVTSTTSNAPRDHNKTLCLESLHVRNANSGLSGLNRLPLTTDGADEIDAISERADPRHWLQIISAFEQPRLSYDINRKQVENLANSPSLTPHPIRRTSMFRQRYHLVRQRILRNESFQISAVNLIHHPSKREDRSHLSRQEAYKLTAIANLLGRGGSQHLLLGQLARSPSGHLILNDLSGSIVLDLQHARAPQEEDAWLTPGMIVVVDGQYEDGECRVGADLDGKTGVGGSIGGIFIVFGLTGPPSERRETTLGLNSGSRSNTGPNGAGFGWVDFLGVGSDRANGEIMRAIEGRVLRRGQQAAPGKGRGRIIILGEVNLDAAKTLRSFRKVLATYAADTAEDTPMTVVLLGNFASRGMMAASGSDGSIEYKEHFDSLASALSDYPTMLHNTTFVFVPGENDPWASAFSAGASTAIPRPPIPELLTSRIRKAFTTANADSERATGKKATGDLVLSTNPTRLALFGSSVEIVLFRDDTTSRLRRNAIRFAIRSDCDSQDCDQDADGGHEVVCDGSSNHQDSAHEDAVLNISDALEMEDRTTEISPETRTARRLVKTVVDQGHLSPFPLSQRPVMWDYAGSLQLYPLPTALVLMDAEAPPFAISLNGCHVMNPGPLAPPNKKGVAQWMEYNVRSRRGRLKEARY